MMIIYCKYSGRSKGCLKNDYAQNKYFLVAENEDYWYSQSYENENNMNGIFSYKYEINNKAWGRSFPFISYISVIWGPMLCIDRNFDVYLSIRLL